ncbi:MAG: PASTA domain-containing protein, partial [Bacteroidales bacterium]|nr:PASTA domain-containing protein [Bacteroidales bacterium]
YNAIANKGRMMKPYLVESIEQHGVVKKKLGPSVLNASICSPATADTLVRGLRSVIEEGTAKRLRNRKWEVAGKTGTSWVVLSPAEAKGSGDPYRDAWGRKKNQATFVGFFPADAPRYTAIVTIYSRLSAKTFYGGTIPAMTMGEIVDNLYAMDNAPTEVLTKKGAFPEMVVPTINAPEDKKKPIVPDVKGMGLEDAVYAIENAGYRCEWTGTGHVAAQSPAAGGAKPAGTIINLTLK